MGSIEICKRFKKIIKTQRTSSPKDKELSVISTYKVIAYWLFGTLHVDSVFKS